MYLAATEKNARPGALSCGAPSFPIDSAAEKCILNAHFMKIAFTTPPPHRVPPVALGIVCASAAPIKFPEEADTDTAACPVAP